MTAALGDKPRGAFTVYIVTARTVGVAGDVTHQTFSFSPSDIPADGTFTYDFSVLTDFLSTRIAVALLDDVSGEMGFVRAELPRHTAR